MIIQVQSGWVTVSGPMGQCKRPAVVENYGVDEWEQVGEATADQVVAKFEADDATVSAIEADQAFAGKVTRL